MGNVFEHLYCVQWSSFDAISSTSSSALCSLPLLLFLSSSALILVLIFNQCVLLSSDSLLLCCIIPLHSHCCAGVVIFLHNNKSMDKCQIVIDRKHLGRINSPHQLAARACHSSAMINQPHYFKCDEFILSLPLF